MSATAIEIVAQVGIQIPQEQLHEETSDSAIEWAQRSRIVE